MINIINLNLENINLLEEFLKVNTKLKQTFRYFNSRKLQIITQHLITRLYFVGEECVGYGHLDFEEKVWLGICVSDSHQNRGYGKVIMNDLLSSYKDDIYLTVDKENIIAIKLYKKYGFEVEKLFDDKILMKKNKLIWIH